MKTTKHFCLMLFLMVICGCIQAEKPFSEEIPKEINSKPIILFCPEDNCEKNLVALINMSKKSIHCAIYDLKLKEVIKILGLKSHEVDVKLILEKNNYDGEIKGQSVILDENKQYMHNKFCIIDNKVVWTGSLNPTERGAYKNNNNVVVVYSKHISSNYEDEFNEMWDGVYGSGDEVKTPIVFINDVKIENYFCPEDYCSEHVIYALNNAKESIYFMTFSFTDEDVADSILFNNVSVKGIVDVTQAGSKYSQYKRLKEFGLDIITDKNKATMHHKVFIIDNSVVITGSYNPTKSGDKTNDENLLIIHDSSIAELFLKEFDKVWNLKN